MKNIIPKLNTILYKPPLLQKQKIIEPYSFQQGKCIQFYEHTKETLLKRKLKYSSINYINTYTELNTITRQTIMADFYESKRKV